MISFIVLQCIYVPYVMSDYLSIGGCNWTKKITDIRYTNEMMPGDKKITGIEYILFYMVLPMISAIMFIEIMRKNYVKQKE